MNSQQGIKKIIPLIMGFLLVGVSISAIFQSVAGTPESELKYYSQHEGYLSVYYNDASDWQDLRVAYDDIGTGEYLIKGIKMDCRFSSGFVGSWAVIRGIRKNPACL